MINPDKLFGRLGNRMFQMAYIYSQMKDGKIPDIYVQDFTLFDKYEKEIKEWFGEGIGFINYVAIHVRRGGNPSNPSEPNYFDNPFYINLCDTDYYEKAIALFPYDQFIVFSDDPEWCKEKWGNNPRFSIQEKGDEIEDFNMIASCKSIITANSSYSWWCGYLCINPAKIIVYSDKWFADDKQRVTFPSTWKKIQTNKN